MMVIGDESLHYAGNLPLHGGRLCLDFVNTIDWRLADYRSDWLRGYGDLVAWSRHVAIVTEEQAERLQAVAAERPAEAQAVLERAHLLREAMYRVFAAVLAGEDATQADLQVLDAALQQSFCRLRLRWAAGQYELVWPADERLLDGMLWPVARSAAALLTSREIERVRRCAGDPCGWLFLDESRNRSRRWCTMSGCGNRAKAKRHYERRRENLHPDTGTEAK
ncbi:MAG: CGNR zinc finger domain-containing protein [Anaerolineae bacterium]